MDDYTPSVLDRLTDPDLPVDRCRYAFRELERSVVRDLTELLNTRRPPEGFYDGLPAVAESVANYGLRDMTVIEGSVAQQRMEFARHIQQVIETFEPRLTDVAVVARNPDEVRDERPTAFSLVAMYFRIRATLNVDPNPIDGVTFDTVFEVATGTHTVNLPGATR